MHNIILIEELTVTNEGHLKVVAILEQETREEGCSYLATAPNTAPVRAITTIPVECLPANRTFTRKSRQQLLNMIERYRLFTNQEWSAHKDDQVADHKDEPYQGGRIPF